MDADDMDERSRRRRGARGGPVSTGVVATSQGVAPPTRPDDGRDGFVDSCGDARPSTIQVSTSGSYAVAISRSHERLEGSRRSAALRGVSRREQALAQLLLEQRGPGLEVLDHVVSLVALEVATPRG